MVEKGKVKQDRRMAIQAAEVAIRSIDDVIKEHKSDWKKGKI